MDVVTGPSPAISSGSRNHLGLHAGKLLIAERIPKGISREYGRRNRAAALQRGRLYPVPAASRSGDRTGREPVLAGRLQPPRRHHRVRTRSVAGGRDRATGRRELGVSTRPRQSPGGAGARRVQHRTERQSLRNDGDGSSRACTTNSPPPGKRASKTRRSQNLQLAIIGILPTISPRPAEFRLHVQHGALPGAERSRAGAAQWRAGGGGYRRLRHTAAVARRRDAGGGHHIVSDPPAMPTWASRPHL